MDLEVGAHALPEEAGDLHDDLVHVDFRSGDRVAVQVALNAMADGSSSTLSLEPGGTLGTTPLL